MNTIFDINDMTDVKRSILYIHHSGLFGGAPRSLSYLVKNIDSKIFNVKLINISDGPINQVLKELPGQFEIVKGIRPFHGSTVAPKSIKLLIRNLFFLVPSILNAYKVLKKYPSDLIHLNSTCLFCFAIALKFLKRKTRIIAHVREPLRSTFSGRLTAYFIKNCTDGVIAISDYDLSTLQIEDESFPKIVVYNFVEESDIPTSSIKNYALHEELNISHNSFVILYLARFADSNGWKELIKMALKIIPENSNFHFALVGAHEKEDLNYINNKNIHLLPFQKEVSTFFLNSDLFICPFVEPHFARGIIEASYAGLPVLANNVESVNELVMDGKTGFLYNNFLEFKNYLQQLANDSLLRNKLGSNGKIYAKKNFNLQKQCKLTFDFYLNILDKH